MTSSPSPPATRRGDNPIVVFWRVLRANPLSLFGFLLVSLICIVAVIVAVAPHLLVPYGPTQETGPIYAPPSWAHPLGTDGLSFDVYSNVMLALPLDLGLGVGIAAASLVVGGVLGLLAGFYDRPGTVGGYASVSIMRVTDIFLSFPSLILALAITRVLGISIINVAIAITITWWPYYVRLIRGEVLSVKHLPYVTAARAAGVTENRILLRHVLRNVTEPLIVYFTLDIGTVLVTYSTIAYIGVASKYPGPTPEWGSMMAYYQSSAPISSYPWLVLAPGAAVFITVIAFSLLGDGLRDILDPRTRRAFVRSTNPEPPAERALIPVTPLESRGSDPMADGGLGTPDPGGGGG